MSLITWIKEKEETPEEISANTPIFTWKILGMNRIKKTEVSLDNHPSNDAVYEIRKLPFVYGEFFDVELKIVISTLG